MLKTARNDVVLLVPDVVSLRHGDIPLHHCEVLLLHDEVLPCNDETSLQNDVVLLRIIDILRRNVVILSLLLAAAGSMFDRGYEVFGVPGATTLPELQVRGMDYKQAWRLPHWHKPPESVITVRVQVRLRDNKIA